MASKPTSALRKQFGRRLAAARLSAGFETAEDFADKLGITPAAYRKNERDGALPKYETLLEIARLLDCDMHWLLTGTKIDRQGKRIPHAA